MADHNRLLRRALPVLVAVAACAGLAGYLLTHRQQWQGLSVQRPALVAVCGTACLVVLLVPGPIFQLLTSRVGVATGLVESTCLAILTSAINMVVPLHGGVAARGVYLKKRYGLELSRFAATFLGYNILRLCAAAALACGAGLWLLWQQASGPDGGQAAAGRGRPVGLLALVAVSAAMAAAALATCFVSPAWLERVGMRAHATRGLGRDGLTRIPWLRPIVTLHAGWVELTRSPAFLFYVLGLVVLQVLAEVVMVWAAWNAVGATVSPVAASLVASFGILTALTGLTPGGLGLVELVAVGVGTTVAVSPAHGVAAGLLARGVCLAILGVTAPPAFLWLARRSTAP